VIGRHIDERHFMSSTQAAVILGASGSVGHALIKELIRNGSFKPIVTLVRRSQPDQVAIARDAGVELRETLVPQWIRPLWRLRLRRPFVRSKATSSG
jgi:hypothetical protein